MKQVLFIDYIPNDLTTIISIVVVLFILVFFWTIRTNKSRQNRKSRSFRDRYYEKKDNK